MPGATSQAVAFLHGCKNANVPRMPAKRANFGGHSGNTPDGNVCETRQFGRHSGTQVTGAEIVVIRVPFQRAKSGLMARQRETIVGVKAAAHVPAGSRTLR